eukprot:GHVU01076989.1.p1 GENE.GHVU01076989.1~~GHVU01076989.1.p1  ORF type:complete len:109 (+),score=0.08 GHVU01076989.1:161-487(+)
MLLASRHNRSRRTHALALTGNTNLARLFCTGTTRAFPNWNSPSRSTTVARQKLTAYCCGTIYHQSRISRGQSSQHTAQQNRTRFARQAHLLTPPQLQIHNDSRSSRKR